MGGKIITVGGSGDAIFWLARRPSLVNAALRVTAGGGTVGRGLRRGNYPYSLHCIYDCSPQSRRSMRRVKIYCGKRSRQLTSSL